MDDSTFRVVLRGFDPDQVNRRLEELTTAVAQARAQRDAMAARLGAVEQDRSAADTLMSDAPTYEQVGARVGQILSLASEEAEDLRRTAEAEIAASRQRLEEETTRIREDADRYAAETRSTAETEAARIVEDARRAADEQLDNAEREAAARIQDAEDVYEQQRTKAVQSAADFESTLAARRKASEEGFKRQMAEVELRLDEARDTLEKARAAAEQTVTNARREAGSLVRNAEERAKSVVEDAEATAARMRAESERELAAATQRREAINAQLGNVRQMLATLTGSVTPSHAPPGAGRLDEPDAPADDEPAEATEPAEESGVEAR